LWRYKDDLQPFRDFLRHHNIPEDAVLQGLFKAGPAGKKLMLQGRQIDRSSQSNELKTAQDDDLGASFASAFPWEHALSAWNTALSAENLPFSAASLLTRWPRMLITMPTQLPETVAVLRAAYSDDQTVLHEAIGECPWLLGSAPLHLHQRLLSLQTATEGALPQLLLQCPKLLCVSLDRVLANLRLVRQHCFRPKRFHTALLWQPGMLLANNKILKSRFEQRIAELRAILPENIDPVQVAGEYPALLLTRHDAIQNAWKTLQKAVASVPAWQEELDAVLVDAAGSSVRAHSSEEGVSDLNKVGAAPPADHGVEAAFHQLHASTTEDYESGGGFISSEQGGDADGQIIAANDVDEKSSSKEPTDHVTRAVRRRALMACTALGRALWHSRPFNGRGERLIYLAEMEPKKASGVSILAVLDIDWQRFHKRFPHMKEWEEKQRALQRQPKTHEIEVKVVKQ
jgi:hypothetical protein